MALDSSNKIKVPPEERKFISPELRTKLFTEIYKGYTKRYGLKLLFAYLNTDPEIFVDYLIVYKTRNDDDTADLILYDIPPIYSDRCTPCYRYYRKTKNDDKFFSFGIDDIVIMDRNKFNEYLIHRLELSLDKNDPLYWKNPQNYKELLPGLLDLSLQYVKKPKK